mmetsp:Transcript_12513/g.35150  ORF Transcript_12513/g.35150 Transcript_12513/m.35150 type:complete len:208 (-) Transcript_12513:1112-1735(-)
MAARATGSLPRPPLSSRYCRTVSMASEMLFIALVATVSLTATESAAPGPSPPTESTNTATAASRMEKHEGSRSLAREAPSTAALWSPWAWVSSLAAGFAQGESPGAPGDSAEPLPWQSLSLTSLSSLSLSSCLLALGGRYSAAAAVLSCVEGTLWEGAKRSCSRTAVSTFTTSMRAWKKGSRSPSPANQAGPRSSAIAATSRRAAWR